MGPTRLAATAVAAAVATALVGLAAAPAPAQATAALLLDPTSGPAGTAVEAEARGLPVGEPFLAYLRFEGAPAGDYLAEAIPITADRTFEAAFVVPPGTPAGPRVVEVCARRSQSAAETCDRMPTARFEVTSRRTTTTTTTPRPTAPSTEPPLVSPTTSSSTSTTAGVGLATTTTTVPGDVAAATTSPPPTFGVDDLAGSTTAPGLGLGELTAIEGELPDLRITGMEITQGIQNLDNDMPLVAGRTTVLRVYVQTDGEPLPHVSGVLQLVRHTDQEVAVLQPDNGPLTVTGDPPDRLDVDGSLNFTLPPEATAATSQGDRLVATAFVFGTHPTTPALHEPTDVDNYEAEVFDFHTTGHFTLHLLPMHMHEVPLPTAPDATYLTDPTDLFALAATVTSLYRYHPVSGVDAVLGPTVHPPLHGFEAIGIPPQLTEWDLTLPGVETSILGQVQDVWAETSATTSHLEQFYGIYREDLPREWGGFSNGTVAYGYYDLAFGETKPWYHRAGWLAAHELGHSIGFAHVACSGSEGNPGDYPWSDPCSLGPVDPEGFYGWDIRHDAFAVTDGPAVISQAPGLHPDNGYPYMGYQSSKWADPWHYCRALERFGVECRALPIPENEPGATEGPDLTATAPYEPVAGQTGWVLVNAVAHEVTSPPDPEGASGDDTPLAASRFGISIDGTAIMAEPLPHVLDAMAERRRAGTPSGVTAVVVDPAGEALAELELVVVNADGGDAPDTDTGIAPDDGHPAAVPMTDHLPWFDDAAGVELRRDGEVVAERRVSASDPTIEVLSPAGGELTTPLAITWAAADADGDDLTFDIGYSPDGGATWAFVADDVRGDEYVLEDASTLAGGDEAIFRVTASDGFRTASASSAPGSLADGPPQLLLLSPGEGSTVPLHRAVTLLASASDREDGPGSGVQVQWSSDLDGPLGIGEQLVTSALSPGTHRITATAIDSAGGATATSVAITVDAATALERLDADGMRAALSALGSGPVGPAVDETDGRGVVWLAAAMAAVAAVAAPAAVRRSRASVPATDG